MKSKLGVVILQFNQAHLTNLCIDSILSMQTDLTLDVLVIDNASQSSEVERLERVINFIKKSSANPTINLIKNDGNLGFAGGMNQGIQHFLNDPTITHICLLNNDTVLTDFCLDDLVNNATTGLTGPVSNSVGNEQIVGVTYETFGFNGYSKKAISQFAAEWRSSHLGSLAKTDMLGFLCVVGPVEVFKAVGPLDTTFGIGYYEDDDYCHRVLNCGYDLTIIRSSFIHHWGSATFGTLEKDALKKLFSTNREKFISKHGTTPKDHSQAWLKALLLEMSWRKSQNLPENNWMNRWPIPGGYSSPRQILADKVNNTIDRKFKSYQLRRALKALNALAFDYNRPAVAKRISFKILDTIKHTSLSIFGRVRSYMDFRLFQKTTVIIFPIQSYFGRTQRPQHIAKQLARLGHRVIWIEPQIGSVSSKEGIHYLSQNQYILFIKGIDYRNFYNSAASTAECKYIWAQIQEMLPTTGVVALLQSPFWVSIAKHPTIKTIYDCMDDHSAFGSSTIENHALEDETLSLASNIVTSSSHLNSLVESKTGYKTPIIRNGCNPNDFKVTLKKTEKIIVGYFGAVAEWFDTDLVIETAKLLPHVEFQIIGNTKYSDFELREYPQNIKLVGEIPYVNLRDYSNIWNAAIIPFKITPLIQATNPVKLYEYFALGLPVVSTPLPEVQICEITVPTTDDPNLFAEMITTQIKHDSEEKRTQRRLFAANNSWNARGAEFNAVLGSLL